MATLSQVSGISKSAILSQLTFTEETPLSQISCDMQGSAAVSVEARLSVNQAFLTPAKNKGGRPRKYATNADRQAAYDARKRGEALEAERLATEAKERNEDALNRSITGGLGIRELDFIQGAKFRSTLLTNENPKVKHGGERTTEDSAQIEYTHKHSTAPNRRVRPAGAEPPSDSLDCYVEEQKENRETDSTFAPSDKQLMKQGKPLPRKGRDGFIASVRRVFCKAHSLVELGTQGETFIDFSTNPPSRVLLFAAHFDSAAKVWRLDCGCERPEKDFHHRRYYKPKESENE
jgi:hypothetical protein